MCFNSLNFPRHIDVILIANSLLDNPEIEDYVPHRDHNSPTSDPILNHTLKPQLW